MAPRLAEHLLNCAQSPDHVVPHISKWYVGVVWRPWSFLVRSSSQQPVRGDSSPGVCHAAARACSLQARRAGLFEVTVAMCILNLFSGMRTAGTWPMHYVCSSYLVGFVMCGGVAKGSGNVDFFFPA